MFENLLPFASDLGATSIIFALLIYSWYQSKQQHERTMARDKQMLENSVSINLSLIECLKTLKKETDA